MIIHPKHPTADDTYYIGGAWAPACITAKDKRFTGAELAAEYWRASCHKTKRPDIDKTWDQREWEHDILYRFLTLPSYDQERP